MHTQEGSASTGALILPVTVYGVLDVRDEQSSRDGQCSAIRDLIPNSSRLTVHSQDSAVLVEIIYSRKIQMSFSREEMKQGFAFQNISALLKKKKTKLN